MAVNNYNPLDDKSRMYSSDIRTFEKRILRYKDFTFPYGPISIEVSEDSRIAEYNYLFTNGIELAKVRGRKTFRISGIIFADHANTGNISGNNEASSRKIYNGRALNNEVYPGVKYNEAVKIRQKLDSMANGVAGVLVTPDMGVYNTVFLVSHSFTEEGDYQRQYRYNLEFVVHNQVPPVTRISAALQKTQIELPDVDKQHVSYTIKSGDTLSAIAARFGMSLSQLKALNPSLVDAKHKGGNLIHVGEVVNIIKGTAYTEKPVGGKKTTKPKGNTKAVPRGSEAATYLNGKDTGVIKPTDPTNGALTIVNGYANVIGGIATFNPITVINGVGYIRSGTTTLEEYNKASGKTVAANTDLFPSFSGVVAYGSSTTVDTKKSLSIDDSKQLIA